MRLCKINTKYECQIWDFWPKSNLILSRNIVKKKGFLKTKTLRSGKLHLPDRRSHYSRRQLFSAQLSARLSWLTIKRSYNWAQLSITIDKFVISDGLAEGKLGLCWRISSWRTSWGSWWSPWPGQKNTNLEVTFKLWNLKCLDLI